jgi:hypothetical protein
MTGPPWQRFYEVLPDGRFRISTEALNNLETEHPDRILVTLLRKNPAKVLLLDKPLQLKEKAYGSSANAFYLRRIPLRDLPGWPPILAPGGLQKEIPPAIDCRLKGVRFIRGQGAGQEGMEFTLEYRGETFRAWMVGCPLPLLKSVQKTLVQEGTAGKNLLDLQELRLVGAD